VAASPNTGASSTALPAGDRGAAAPAANGTYLDALAVGEFRALFAAYTVSMLGDIVAAVALILEVTPEHLLGRVLSVNQAGLISLQGLGFAAAGALAEVVSPHVAIIIAAVAGLALVAALAPGIRAPHAPGGRGAASAAALL
jgi:hypothetical protein